MDNITYISVLIFVLILLVYLAFMSRFKSYIWMHLAWFAPHKKLRALFHKLRGVNIGKNVEIGYMVSIDATNPEKIIIKDDATIALGSVILSHAAKKIGSTLHDSMQKTAPVIIAEKSFIGANCVILPGVTIGRGAVVSAGSVVHSDVPDNAVVGGNPAISMYKLLRLYHKASQEKK